MDSAVQISNLTPSSTKRHAGHRKRDGGCHLRSSYSLSSLHSTVRWEVSSIVIGSSVTGRSCSPLSHHVVVVVPVNDVGWREQLLLDGGGRGRGWLHPGFKQVWHIEHLVDTHRGERGEETANREDIRNQQKKREGKNYPKPNKDGIRLLENMEMVI